MKRIEISPSTFFAYKDNDNKIHINVTAVIQVIFHEFFGHALQEFNSRILPESIRDDSINTAVPTMSIHAEGYAQMMDEFSINFMNEFKNKYKIDDDYIKQRELSLRRKDIQLFWNYYQYLKLKNFEKEFDYKKKFLKYTNNFGALTNYECSQNEPFSFFKSISYVFGLKKVKEIHKKLIQEYGEKNSALINKSLSTGLLNINVLYNFAKYYIEQNLKNKNKI